MSNLERRAHPSCLLGGRSVPMWNQTKIHSKVDFEADQTAVDHSQHSHHRPWSRALDFSHNFSCLQEHCNTERSFVADPVPLCPSLCIPVGWWHFGPELHPSDHGTSHQSLTKLQVAPKAGCDFDFPYKVGHRKKRSHREGHGQSPTAKLHRNPICGKSMLL